MPCNYKKYPENWTLISKQVIKDAGNKCELCYAPNGLIITRFKNDHTHPWEHSNSGTKIVLTVHHIDCDTDNNTKHNLIALCQKCHLRLDLQNHLRRSKHKYQNDAAFYRCVQLIKIMIRTQNYTKAQIREITDFAFNYKSEGGYCVECINLDDDLNCTQKDIKK
jgi:hypothetical protein